MDGGNATIIAAVIAAVASLVSAGIALYNAKDSKKGAAQRDEVNNRTNSEIAMFEQDAENKRNETQIDASVVWSARVEWIQNVRRETSDLLTAINNYIYSDENDVDLVKMNLMSVREKSNLLILYFGPDKVENDKVDLLNKGDNISKNQHIPAAGFIYHELCTERNCSRCHDGWYFNSTDILRLLRLGKCISPFSKRKEVNNKYGYF